MNPSLSCFTHNFQVNNKKTIINYTTSTTSHRNQHTALLSISLGNAGKSGHGSSGSRHVQEAGSKSSHVVERIGTSSWDALGGRISNNAVGMR